MDFPMVAPDADLPAGRYELTLSWTNAAGEQCTRTEYLTADEVRERLRTGVSVTQSSG